MRFALLSELGSAVSEAARSILQEVRERAPQPVGEIETNLMLLELKLGEVDAARERLAGVVADAPRSVELLQHLHDTYPWVREVFEQNGLRLSDGELLSLRRLP